MHDKVFVITLNWNGGEYIIDCLNSVKDLISPVEQIVVVDNGSTDDSVDNIKTKFPDVKVIENKSNLGYSLGFNKGIEYSMKKGADFMLIMNNDTVIDPHALGELLKTIKENNQNGFVSGKVFEHQHPNIIQTVGRKTDAFNLVSDIHIGAGQEDTGQYDNLVEYDYIDDVFLLVRKEVIYKTGGYDASFFLYYEETDWCSRVRKAGFRIIYTPYAKIWHKGSLSSGGGMNPMKRHWLSRNQYLFVIKNGSNFQKFFFLIKKIFLNLPIMSFSYFRKNRKDLIIPLIRGNLSGLIWLVNHR